jgi:hypothetical protein
LDTLRRKSIFYSLTREDFTRYIGGRNREAVTIFQDLDTDFNGRVDIFEVLVTLTIWSGTPWHEKQTLLFDIFDIMGKGFLKIDEVIFMGTIIVQTLAKFVKVDKKLINVNTLTDMAQQAFPPPAVKLTLEQFQLWVKDCPPFEQLRQFIQDHAARGQAETHESRMRMQISALAKHATRLVERVERLQDRLPDFTDACIEFVSAWGRRKRWDFMMQNMRHLVMKLQQLSESMHSTLADLEQSLHEDEVSGGLSSTVDPRKRFQQEQMLIDLDLMRQQSQSDFREATDLLKSLIELTEANEMQPSMGIDQMGRDSLNVVNEVEGESILDLAPDRVSNNRTLMKQVHSEMLADTEKGGYFSNVGSMAEPEPGQNVAAGGQSNVTQPQVRPPAVAPPGGGEEHSLVAIADFEPPASHQTQMLRLYVGDQVTVIGQDGRGWWFGRKQNGKEGWFPPSYVQIKPAHFTSSPNLACECPGWWDKSRAY